MANEKDGSNRDPEGQATTSATPGPAPKLRLKRDTIRNLRVVSVDDLAVVVGGYEVESKDGGVQC